MFSQCTLKIMMVSDFLLSLYKIIISIFFLCSVARFGLDGAVYTVAEGDDLIVSIYLLENELAVPVPLEIKTTDISAC